MASVFLNSKFIVRANNKQEYFQELTESGQFEKSHLGDRITMLAIYMPIVREATIAYKDLWNCHKIRKQPNRPNAVTRQPMVLYHYPDPEIKSYGEPINQDFISELQASLQEWGLWLFFLCLFCAFSYRTIIF
jgi:hypothetical protein